MGFVVLSERPYRIAVPGGRPIWLQDFEMQRRDGGTSTPRALGPRFTEAFAAVWNGRAENDGFNRLVVVTDLTWRQASGAARVLPLRCCRPARTLQPGVHGAGAGVERRDREHAVAAVRSAVRSGD